MALKERIILCYQNVVPMGLNFSFCNTSLIAAIKYPPALFANIDEKLFYRGRLKLYLSYF